MTLKSKIAKAAAVGAAAGVAAGAALLLRNKKTRKKTRKLVERVAGEARKRVQWRGSPAGKPTRVRGLQRRR